MGIFSKKEVKEGAIINSDEDVQWHINNQDDDNRYVIVRSKFTDFNNSKFLDRVNGGTLFNFGNPLGNVDPHGFTLETFTLKKDDYIRPYATPGDSYWNDVTSLPIT
ncbi:MAG: hypothetical protein QF380_09000, partial [Candidatus Marinimicrobia bacterium]|nr:hypothetical protein [Candidatus Neomarinimicrobiota bacterium]